MVKYVDLVAVRTDMGKRLFRAPAWSHLSEGSCVRVDTRVGTKTGTVLASETVQYEGAEYEFAIKLCGATKPLRKVIAKVVEREFDYSEEEEVEKEEVCDEENDTDE